MSVLLAKPARGALFTGLFFSLVCIPAARAATSLSVVGTEACDPAGSLTGGWTESTPIGWSHTFSPLVEDVIAATLTVDLGDVDGAEFIVYVEGVAIGTISGGDNGGPGTWRCPASWIGGGENTLAIPASVLPDLADGDVRVVIDSAASVGFWGANRAILSVTTAPSSDAATDLEGTDACDQGASLTGGWIDVVPFAWSHSFEPIADDIEEATLTLDVGDADGAVLTVYVEGTAIGTVTGGDNGGPGTWRCPDAWIGGTDTTLAIPESVFPALADGLVSVSVDGDPGLGTWGANRAILSITTGQRVGSVTDIEGSAGCDQATSLSGGWGDLERLGWTHVFAPISDGIAAASVTVDVGDAEGGEFTVYVEGTAVGTATGGDNGGPGAWRCPDAWIGGADNKLVIPASLYPALADGVVSVALDDGGGIAMWGSNRAQLSITVDPTACPYGPLAGCNTAAKGSLSVSAGTVPAKQKLQYKFLKAVNAIDPVTELGDPVGGATDYRVCVWDSSGGSDTLAAELMINSGDDCGGASCWKSVSGGSGVLYKNKTTNIDGAYLMKARGGEAGRGSLKLGAKGEKLSLPAAAAEDRFFEQDRRVTVDVRATDTQACWQSVFDDTTTKKNTASKFKATRK